MRSLSELLFGKNEGLPRDPLPSSWLYAPVAMRPFTSEMSIVSNDGELWLRQVIIEENGGRITLERTLENVDKYIAELIGWRDKLVKLTDVDNHI